MRKILVGVVLVGMFATAHPALSQGIGSGDLELNPFFGGSWYNANAFEISFPQSSPGEFKQFKLEKAFRGGLRFNVYNGGHWGEEFMYSYESNQTRFISVFPPRPELNLGIQVHQFAVNTLYYFDADPDLPVRPFLTFGIGGTLYRPTDEAKTIALDPLRGNFSAFEESLMFSFNYGRGIKIKAGDKVGFRIDARGYVGKSPTFGLPRASTDPTATVFPAGGALHNGEVTAGIVFYLN